MICPRCKHKVNQIKAGIIAGVYIDNYCEHCLPTLRGNNGKEGKYKRDRDREDHRRSIIQPYDGDKPNKEFIRQYPDQARERFNQDQLEKYS